MDHEKITTEISVEQLSTEAGFQSNRRDVCHDAQLCLCPGRVV